uniref:Notch NODP domain-containing protein n=1 Tax=Panagrolaimus sp. ES5 TaxID=591445 RepID=A0AC34GM85_9BILA
MKSDNLHSIKKRSLDHHTRGVKVYLQLDVSVCQQLSSLGASLHLDVQVDFESRKCFTNAQSAADMLAADSRKHVFSDYNITVADARVMSKSSESSSILGYIIFGALAFVAIIITSLNVATKRVKRKIVQSVFFPPTSDDLNKRQ